MQITQYLSFNKTKEQFQIILLWHLSAKLKYLKRMLIGNWKNRDIGAVGIVQFLNDMFHQYRKNKRKLIIHKGFVSSEHTYSVNIHFAISQVRYYVMKCYCFEIINVEIKNIFPEIVNKNIISVVLFFYVMRYDNKAG